MTPTPQLPATTALGPVQLTVADLATCVQVSALLYAQEVRDIARGATNVQPWLDRIDAVAPDR